MSLSVIIINYRSAGLIIDCLESARQFDNMEAWQWIIVDNASGDDSRQKITTRFPRVQWIDMGYNAGFARANNAGIRAATGDTVLLLNPDTLIRDHAIEKCYQALTASGYVACGVQLLNVDGSPQISGNFAMKGGLNYLLPLPFLGECFRQIAFGVKLKKPSIQQATDIAEVDWVNGAFLMVKRTAIDKAGLLDEDFFLYSEEAEWCSRLRKTGKLCIYGNLNVIHLQGSTANETFGSQDHGYYNLYDRKGRQIMISNFVRIRKEFGLGWLFFMLAMYLADIPVFGIGACIQAIAGRKNRYTFKQFRGFVNNMLFILGKTGTIVRNKPYFYKVL
ncbi:glycosyltransferase family 2 protein [Filimonas effusa]|uniref:Glycosyltransferase family 2 protein n=1 Tax=Filimonas effusa TaxID=2508721 RepID=A0A4V1MAR6_9BACT|nr:glycosyltransferase family 2 protein [Filimonas effusa]RXK86806.1 glycosyltransferase family 2 protein [Filimonas effusa]